MHDASTSGGMIKEQQSYNFQKQIATTSCIIMIRMCVDTVTMDTIFSQHTKTLDASAAVVKTPQ